MTLLSIQYPWSKLERGQGFFVPCLDVDAVREEGLKKALLIRMLDARGATCIRNGFTGVWFYRTASRTVPQSGSPRP